MENISIAIDNDLLQRIDNLTADLDCSRSTLIRFMVNDYLYYYEEEITVSKEEYLEELERQLRLGGLNGEEESNEGE